MAATLIVTDVNGGPELDRITLRGNSLAYQTGAARDMFDGLIASGFTPAQAFDLRTDWSNGYVQAKLADV